MARRQPQRQKFGKNGTGSRDWFHRKVARQNPTVAILSQSDRTWQTEAALDTTNITYAVDPADPYDYDLLIIETPDREMFKHTALNMSVRTLLEGADASTKLLFRMRGDPYWGIHHWYDGPWPSRKLKQFLSLKQLEWVDGCVAIAPHQAEKYREKTGNPTAIAQLSRDVSAWPTASHASESLRIVSLTNCMYPQKIKPIIEYAPVVEEILSDVGGYWHIGGKGRYADELVEAVADYAHIDFLGYIDAKEHLADANLMLHLSYFDSFAGAVLEGCASALPVITTDHPAFTRSELPVDVMDSEGGMRELLRQYTEPENREGVGRENMAFVAERYSHERVGEDWAQVLRYFHNDR
jgi:glycosyltransferase involved in cell wall biosynthesis